MKKKIGDFTLREISDICENTEFCENCQFYTDGWNFLCEITNTLPMVVDLNKTIEVPDA